MYVLFYFSDKTFQTQVFYANFLPIEKLRSFKVEFRGGFDFGKSNRQSCDMKTITGLALHTAKSLLAVNLKTNSVSLIDVDKQTILSTLVVSDHNYPWDVAWVDTFQAAVTIPDDSEIAFLKIVEGSLRKANTIRVRKGCRGIIFLRSNFVVSYGQPTSGIQCLTMEGAVLKTFDNPIGVVGSRRLLQEPWYITADDATDSLYVSEGKRPWIVKYNMNGNVEKVIKLKKKDEPVVAPRGLTIGPNASLLLCGCLSNKVYLVLTETGDVFEILGEKEGIISPNSLAYCKETKTVFIGLQSTVAEQGYIIKVFNLNVKTNFETAY